MGRWKLGNGTSWVPQSGVIGSATSPTQSVFHLFGPEPRASVALTQANTGGYVWPGSALSTSSVFFQFDEGLRRARLARWNLVWTPNAAANGMRLVQADAGPANITVMHEFTSLTATTPLNSSVDITTAFNALVDAGVEKQLGHQITAGTTGPVVFLSRLEVVWE